MTKKDYEKFAKMIRELRELADGYEYVGFHTLIFKMGEIFREDNPLFDSYRFQQACKPEQKGKENDQKTNKGRPEKTA